MTDVMGWFARMALIVVASLLLGFGFNAMRPAGIPLIGQWDTSVGVVSPTATSEEISQTIQTVAEARRLWEGGSLFLDARATESYAEGHIKGAVGFSVYEFEETLFDFLDAVSPETPLVTYCSGRLCDESHKLATFLEEAGYTNVRVFADGYPAWVEEGYPVAVGDESGGAVK